MTYKSYLEHTESIFSDLNILDIFEINDFLIAMFMFRNSFKLHKRYKRTNYVKHTLSNKGVDVWNLLESKLKNLNSCNSFKKQIKKYFLLKPT